LDADEQGRGIEGMEVDVLGMSDVRRGREGPARRVDRPERRKLGPAAPEVVAAEQVRGLRPGEDTDATAQTGAGEAVHVVLGQAFVPARPGAPALPARDPRALL